MIASFDLNAYFIQSPLSLPNKLSKELNCAFDL